MIEQIIVFSIVGIAFAFAGRSIYRSVMGKNQGCGCEEGGSCPQDCVNKVNKH